MQERYAWCVIRKLQKCLELLHIVIVHHYFQISVKLFKVYVSNSVGGCQLVIYFSTIKSL